MGLVLKDMLVMRKTIRTYAMFLLFYLVMTVLGLFTISFTTAILQPCAAVTPACCCPTLTIRICYWKI